MKKRPSAAFLVLPWLVAACGWSSGDGQEGGRLPPVVWDSTGVRIVENLEPRQSGWRVGETPLFTLGWGASDPMFTWIQSGRILSDGGALIGEFGEGRVYRIGSDGRVEGTWGRKGEGPGEYQAIDAILLQGDSILVSDARFRRLTVLSSDGELLATHTSPGSFLHQASSFLPDGRILLVPAEGYGAVYEMRPEWVFQTQPILAADLGTNRVDTIADLPHLKRWYGTRGAGPGPVAVKGRAGGTAEGFAWARSDRPEVQWYDASGRLLQVARWNERAVPLTPEYRQYMAQVYEAALRSRGSEESLIAARLSDLGEGLDRHEGSIPYWRSFRVDRLGNAWMNEFVMPDQLSDDWRVVTSDGTFEGWIEIPGVMDVLDITNDRILAVRLDELDVPALVMLELQKKD